MNEFYEYERDDFEEYNANEAYDYANEDDDYEDEDNLIDDWDLESGREESEQW